MTTPHVVTSTLPGSGRPFRIAVTPHAAGVWVEALDGGEPVLIVVNHPITDLARLREVAAVGEALVPGGRR